MDGVLSGTPCINVAEFANGKLKPKQSKDSGFTYRFGLAESIDADDIVTETDGVKLVVDPVSIDLVRGCIVDFVDSLGGSSFKVENPNAASGCGCGSSFSI